MISSNKIFMVKRKEVLENGIYHITHRAPGLEKLFVEEGDYLRMLALLKEIKEKYKLKIFSFVLMPNHIHLLIQITFPNLSEAMHNLYTRYAQYFNNKYERKGPVFSTPYRASLCLDEKYFVCISLYIHLNPVTARLVDHFTQYRWSSVGPYLRSIRRPTFIDYKFILSILNNDLKKARAIYRGLLEEGIELKSHQKLWRMETRKDYNALREFLKDLIVKARGKRIVEDKLSEEISKFEGLKYKWRPESLKAKKHLVLQLRARGYNIGEIAEKLGVNRSTVYRILKVATF